MAIFENIKLDKGLYTTGRGFLTELESVDPSENYKGTSLEGLDAFERQLKRFNIKVSGAGSDTIEKFFKTSDSAALFPEYVARAVRKGKEEADLLGLIVATRTNINGMDYRTIASAPAASEKVIPVVEEGAVIPEANITVQSNLVSLKKRGKMLVASYEALRFQRLDLFTVMLKQIGAYIARTQLSDAVSVIVNGDGNQNPAEEIDVQTAGTITYADLVSFWNSFDPYELNTIVASPDVAAKILNLSEMKDSYAGLDFHGTGKIVTPLGAKLLKSTAVEEGTLLGLDKGCALEMVQAGGIMTEYDKLIDRQLERAAITEIAGFAKIFTEASKVLSV
ncbi:MAG TPA: phage major capsid protein [Ruminococcaceae bacterium]|nr:phage major capsid protein [Oscillospiraceae bacterium]